MPLSLQDGYYEGLPNEAKRMDWRNDCTLVQVKPEHFLAEWMPSYTHVIKLICKGELNEGKSELVYFLAWQLPSFLCVIYNLHIMHS